MVENKDPAVRVERGFWIVTAVIAVLGVLAVIGWYKFPVTDYLPEAVIPANEIDSLFRFLSASSSVVFIIVIGYLGYFAVAFRGRAGDSPNAVGAAVHDNNRLEFWWTAVPAIFIVALAIFSVRIWYQIQIQPNNGLVMESIGHQWYYDFRYPNVKGTIPNEMHLPVNVPVTLHVTSADVIHSFWVPAMRLKADMVPGLINSLRFTPTHAGRYPIICTEFCGVQHGVMNKQVVVIEDRSAFNSWLASSQAKNKNVSDNPNAAAASTVNLSGGIPSAGQQVFTQKCAACHSASGGFSQRIVGPGLKGVMHDPGHPKLVDGDPSTPENVAKILHNGYAGELGNMPSAQVNGLTDKDISNLVAYLATLK
ncbi:MAG: cytochrome c oxidase subunit II [Candidatus Eremiobacteraeota bacterium]|nr:cytochrome c oxidase subunit II [Candidatus Eremiobacteraeota bacterium]